MSIYHEAFLGIGKRFDKEWRVVDFLAENTYLTEDQITDMCDGGTHLGMSVVCLDCYQGNDWFVGFEVGGDSPDTLISHVVDAHERWKAIFKSVEPRVVHAVKIW
jgi:hypothetical protein